MLPSLWSSPFRDGHCTALDGVGRDPSTSLRRRVLKGTYRRQCMDPRSAGRAEWQSGLACVP